MKGLFCKAQMDRSLSEHKHLNTLGLGIRVIFAVFLPIIAGYLGHLFQKDLLGIKFMIYIYCIYIYIYPDGFT